MAKDTAIVPWRSLQPQIVPANVASPEIMVRDFALTLRDVDKRAVSNAFAHEDFGMGAGHLWRKGMSRLRTRLSKLGMQFLGEMLNRQDIDEHSSPEAVLTDNDSISLAESLGYVDATGARRLRSGFELVVHFDSDKATEDMSITEATSIVRACVQYIFGSEADETTLDFSTFRTRLLSESLKRGDPSVDQLLASPLFFIRTALRVLVAGVKLESGARLEHALANLNELLSPMWDSFTDEDRYMVGTTFAELSNDGKKPTAIAGLRKALLRVKGFDFVPENLRSNSFRRAAQAVITAHNNINNFYNEPEPTRQLAAMGSTIPAPALGEVIRAYLLVYLGNMYDQCWESAGTAKQELKKISSDRWDYYFSKVFPGQQDVLEALTVAKPVKNWIALVEILKLAELKTPVGLVRKLLDSSGVKRDMEVMRHATALILNFRGDS